MGHSMGKGENKTITDRQPAQKDRADYLCKRSICILYLNFIVLFYSSTSVIKVSYTWMPFLFFLLLKAVEILKEVAIPS